MSESEGKKSSLKSRESSSQKLGLKQVNFRPSMDIGRITDSLTEGLLHAAADTLADNVFSKQFDNVAKTTLESEEQRQAAAQDKDNSQKHGSDDDNAKSSSARYSQPQRSAKEKELKEESSESEYEEVEEEVTESDEESPSKKDGDDHTEQPDDAKSQPQTLEDGQLAEAVKSTLKRKRTVVRKKKKTKKAGAEAEEEKEELVKEKGIQMPEWTEALEVEYMTQDQLKRVMQKLRDDGMTDEDIKLGEDIYYRRAAFQMDKYVKMCEVREIVQDGIHSILDRMRKADELARKNRTELTVIESKVKAHQSQINHLKRLDNGQTTLIRMQKDQEMRITEILNNLQDYRYEIHVKSEERKDVELEINTAIIKLNNMTEALDIATKGLTEKVQRDREAIYKTIGDDRASINEQIRQLTEKVTELPQLLKREKKAIQIMQKDIETKSAEQFDTICSTLKVDTERLISLEAKISTLRLFEKKFEHLSNEVTKLRSLEDLVFQANCFLERTLPSVIHHQVSEGLNIVAGPYMNDLMEWEKRKTDEVYEHMKLCEGTKPDLKRFREAHEKFCECAWKYKIGSAPFHYGEDRDYWAEMPPKYSRNYDKRDYHATRAAPVEKRIRDQEIEKRTAMEDHVNYCIMVEREQTKAMVQQLVSQIQSTSKPSNAGRSVSKPKAQMSRVDRQAPSSSQTKKRLTAAVVSRQSESVMESFANQAKSVGSQDGNPLSIASPKSIRGSQNDVNKTAIKIENNSRFEQASNNLPNVAQLSEHEMKLEIGTEADESVSQSAYSRRVVQEVKVYQNVKYFRKLDQKRFRQMRKVMDEYMANGRTEFGRQLSKWQEFFDENNEDLVDLESRLQQLEILVNIVTGSIEMLEANQSKVSTKKALADDKQDQSDTSNESPTFQKGRAIKRSGTIYQGASRLNKRGSSGSLSNMANMAKKSIRSNSLLITEPTALGSQPGQSQLMAIEECKFEEGDDNKAKEGDEAQIDPLKSTEILSPSRKQRLAKLEDTQRKVKFAMDLDDKSSISLASQSTIKDPRTPNLQPPSHPQPTTDQTVKTGGSLLTQKTTMTNTSRDDTTNSLSEDADASQESLDTVERANNKEAERKGAGRSFHFAKQFNRQTMSRTDLTKFIAERFNTIWTKTENFQALAESRYASFEQEKIIIADQNKEFQDKLMKAHQTFTDDTTKMIKDEALKMQKLLLERINEVEAQVVDFNSRLKNNERDIGIMSNRMEIEYQDFSNKRKRWKSDFATATLQAKQNMNAIRDMLSGCENQNEINTRAIKLLLDTQMIEQLVQRQEVEDRKRLLVLGSKKDKELLSTDLGVHESQINGPKINPKTLKNDRAKSQVPAQSSRTSTQGDQPKTQNLTIKTPGNNNYATDNMTQTPAITAGTGAVGAFNSQDYTAAGSSQPDQSDVIKDFENNASRIDPPLLRIDRNCLSCAENKAQTLQAFKIACLTHTQSPIPYQGKNYHVSDLLDVKAKLVARCQKMVRDNLFQTKENVGIDIRHQEDERAFVITPLINTIPIRVEQSLDEVLKSADVGFIIEPDGKNSSLMGTQNPTMVVSNHERVSIEEGSTIMVANKEPRYDVKLNTARKSPQKAPEQSVDEPLDLNLTGDKMHINNDPGSPYASTQANRKVGSRGGAGSHRNHDELVLIQSMQHNIDKDGNDDLFSSNNNLTAQSISVAHKIQRGGATSQLTNIKDRSAAVTGRSNFAHIRFSSTSRIQNLDSRNTGHQNSDMTARRSLYEPSNQVDSSNLGAKKDMLSGPALPDVNLQRGHHRQKHGNMDFDHMFENSHLSSTKHGSNHVRHSSQMTSTNNNFFSSQQKHGAGVTTASRYTGQIPATTANRIGHNSALEDNYRATDGFKNMPMKKFQNKKLSEFSTNLHTNRPQTQENVKLFGNGVKRVSSLQSGQRK